MRGFVIAAIIMIALTASVGTAFADSVGIGLTVADDFPDVPSQDEVYSRLFATDSVTPGFIVFFRDDYWGMSFDFGMNFGSEDLVITPDEPWWMDFDATMTYDWHIFRRFVIDPYVQLGAGMDSAFKFKNQEHPDEIRMAFHPVLGAGVNVYLGHLYLRGNLQYQATPWLVPEPSIVPYQVSPYRVLLSAGFHIH